MWGRLSCCQACPQGFPRADAHTRCFYSLHISCWSKEMADGCVLFCCRGSSAHSMETQAVLTIWSWSLVRWHHIPGDLIQQLVPYNFSVHKPAHPQTHPASGGLALPCALCHSLQTAQSHHLLPDVQPAAQPWRRKPSSEGASVPCCAPKSTLNLHPGTTIHIV